MGNILTEKKTYYIACTKAGWYLTKDDHGLFGYRARNYCLAHKFTSVADLNSVLDSMQSPLSTLDIEKLTITHELDKIDLKAELKRERVKALTHAREALLTDLDVLHEKWLDGHDKVTRINQQIKEIENA